MRPKDFFQNKAWKKWDKSQWTILILTGILLMVAAIPTGARKEKETEVHQKEEQKIQDITSQKDYAQELEVKLKDTLSKINGVGQVEVMITLEDMGESVIEKDQTNETSDLQKRTQASAFRGNRMYRQPRRPYMEKRADRRNPLQEKRLSPK